MLIKDFIFNKYDENILRSIEDYLEYIDPMPERIFKNSALFKEDFFTYKDKNKLLRHVDEDILYQENIAKILIKNSKKANIKTRLISYHWCCQIEQVENCKYLSITVLVELEDYTLGDIGFPIMILATAKNEFRYWEILHIDSAMQSVRDIFGQEDFT